MTALLEVENVRHSFRGLQVLKDVSFAVGERRIVGLIGPNGAGKSTLFNIISGFLAPDGGVVRYAGEDLCRVPVSGRSRRGLVRTFQTPQVFAHMTVRENLMAGLHKDTRSGVLAGLLATPGARAELARMRAAADDACRRFGLWAVRERAAGTLPAGQRRLLELARAVVGQPRLLCLDEPSSGLNSEEVAQLMALLRELNRDGIAILLVSHDMDLVTVAGETHVLCFGEIIASGSLAGIQADARVREVYLGNRAR
jgi:branched-chain amino acid transport system ATP-binding protein/nonpolar-amino-acid-transporting ATPase